MAAYIAIYSFIIIQFLFHVSLLWVMNGSYFGFGSPQLLVDMHKGQKNILYYIVL